nr:immunoglobulin heavy chain junction region [Mus musculus]
CARRGDWDGVFDYW